MPKDVFYVADQESGRILPFEKKVVTYSEDYLKKFGLIRQEGRNDGDYKAVEGKPGTFILYPQGRIKMQNKEILQEWKHQEANAAHWRRVHEQQLDHDGINLTNLKENPEKMLNELKHAGQTRFYEDARMYLTMLNQEEKAKAELQNLRNKYLDKETGQLNILTSTDNFAKQKAKQTFVELGLAAYDKPSKPMIVIENFYPEHALSSPKILADTVKEIRAELAQKLTKERGISIEKAKKEANELVGMNVDIGHINLWKRYGKDKDMMKELENAAPYIKHAHITDNFGDYDAHLPVGWGNAPIKEFLTSLKKHGWKGKAILETFGAMQYGGGGFGVPQSMYGLNASMVPGGPSWETAGNNYFSAGYSFTTGPILPDVNFQTYGVGFSGLPYATGGQIGGGKPGEKFSGTPMS
jgi:hypothetical protein